MKKDPIIYLNHILDCTAKIMEYTREMNKEKFMNSPIVQDAVIRNLEIIGEATKQLDHEFRSKHPDIPWKNIAGLQDKLIHDYIGVDLWAVWRIVEFTLPGFQTQIQEIIGNEK